MIKSYITIAIRNLLKHKFYTLINIFGLAIGIAICLILVFYVKNELSYDTHNEKLDRMYRLSANIKFGGNYMQIPQMPAPLGPALMSDFPDIESTVRFRGQGSFLVKRPEGENITQFKCIYVDSTVFDVFTIPLIKGGQSGILSRPGTVAISESASEIYFHGEDPIGKTLIFDNRNEFEVTAVYEDMPQNSHFHYDYLLTMESLDESRNGIWLSHNFYTYILYKESVSDPDWDSKFQVLIEKYIGPQVMQFMNKTMEEMEASDAVLEYEIMPVKDIHLYSNLGIEMENNGNIQYVYIFSIIGFFVLVIACINFMNLATARSSTRSKEVGIRKVMGSFRSQIIFQFLAEAFVVTAIAFLIGIILIELLMPVFNEISGQDLTIQYLSDPTILIAMVVMFLIVGLLSGSYPAFFLSSFAPVSVLKGKLQSAMRSGSLRKVLVVIQFSISIMLVIGSLVITKQLRYIQNYQVGFDKEQVLIVQDAYALGNKLETFKEELSGLSDVKSVTVSGYLPVSYSSRSDNAFWPEGANFGPETSVSLQNWRVDEDYIETMGMDIIAGRNFSKDMPTDTAAVILNERAASLFGIADDPIGATISTRAFTPEGQIDFDKMLKFEVIGIVKDFNFDSFKSNINALGLFNLPSSGFINVKLRSENITSTVDLIETKWKSMIEDQPFAYSFLDQRFDEMYKNEQKVARLVSVFASLSIFIACLGLFALAAFTAEQRTKEIGVRKVLGASILDIVLLLTREFNKLVIISFLLAAPLAWYGMERWLQDFVYRTDISYMVLMGAGIISFIVAWLTMSYQSVKAGMADPVKSLRYE